MNSLTSLGESARAASRELSRAPSAVKNSALTTVAAALRANCAVILEENAKDLADAAKNGITEAMQDRLRLTGARVDEIADAVLDVVRLADPVGEVIGGGNRRSGLKIEKVRVPLGVVGIIYESRPNVTADAAALCLKSGNACILRGGKEAIRSNIAIVEAMRAAIISAGLPADCVQLVTDITRASAEALMTLNGFIDVLIPRGSAGLIRSVVENATVPVIETGAGNCHIYVDSGADLEMAASICDNAKTSRPSVCNAVETVLVHRDAAPEFLPKLAAALKAHNVELRGCARTAALIPGITPATESDYATEFDDYILALRVVDSFDEAIAHIQKYSTGHSEAIITRDYGRAMEFTSRIDAAAVYVNASTRFTDGAVFGLGAEIGISTQKLHARGPMGLTELCSCKYIVTGNGQIR